MTTLTETRHAGESIVSEANGTLSREQITVLSGQTLKAGHIIGKVLTGTAVATAFANNAANTGTMGAVTVSGAAKRGVYKLLIVEPATDAGAFTVSDPDGVLIGTGVVAVAFSAGGLAFTLADGATNFISGEGFNIAVTETAAKYKEYNPANTDGSQVPAGVLLAAVDAAAADKAGVGLVRNAEILKEILVWFSGANATQIAAGVADLAKLGLIGR